MKIPLSLNHIQIMKKLSLTYQLIAFENFSHAKTGMRHYKDYCRYFIVLAREYRLKIKNK